MIYNRYMSSVSEYAYFLCHLDIWNDKIWFRILLNMSCKDCIMKWTNGSFWGLNIFNFTNNLQELHQQNYTGRRRRMPVACTMFPTFFPVTFSSSVCHQVAWYICETSILLTLLLISLLQWINPALTGPSVHNGALNKQQNSCHT